MKYLVSIAISFSLWMLSDSAIAQVREPKELSEERASQVFWRFTTCLVDNGGETVRLSLDRRDDFSFFYAISEEQANKLTKRYSRCLSRGDTLKMNLGLFLGALTTSLFVKKYQGHPLPSYDSLPPLVTNETFEVTQTGEVQTSLLMMAFGECVFRTRPEDVRAYLETAPSSEEEERFLAELNDTLASCLPATEGAQITFSPVGLRSVLGETAFYVDDAHSRMIAQSQKVAE